jgi:hypothetical protein
MSRHALAVAVAVAIAIAAIPSTGSASPGAGTIASSDGSSIYMVAPVAGGTVVTRIDGKDRTAQVKRRLPGLFEVPSVAGVKGGLSRDGSTLVLGGHPAAELSQFAVLDAPTLRVERVLSLRGTYSFDAMSPDASTLYVIRFLDEDGTHYKVQAVDMTVDDAQVRTVVEKGEPGEPMSGQALTRTSSADGNWVYTLYDGAGHEPFIHALSTVDTFTVCIDLEALEGRPDLDTLSLALDDNTLAVKTGSGTPIVNVDTETFEVTEAPAVPATRSPTTPRAQADTPEDIPWLPIGALLATLAAAATVLLIQRKARQI